MGRWSRGVGSVFLDWLAPPAGARWLEVGCGSGAFTAAGARRLRAREHERRRSVKVADRLRVCGQPMSPSASISDRGCAGAALSRRHIRYRGLRARHQFHPRSAARAQRNAPRHTSWRLGRRLCLGFRSGTWPKPAVARRNAWNRHRPRAPVAAPKTPVSQRSSSLFEQAGFRATLKSRTIDVSLDFPNFDGYWRSANAAAASQRQDDCGIAGSGSRKTGRTGARGTDRASRRQHHHVGTRQRNQSTRAGLKAAYAACLAICCFSRE